MDCGLTALPDREMGMEHKVAIFRIPQEVLRNTSQHSGASRAWIPVGVKGAKLKVIGRDNGKGFNLLGATANYWGQGLV